MKSKKSNNINFHLGLNLKAKNQNPNPIRQGRKKLAITRHHSKREQAHAASTFFVILRLSIK